MAGVWTRVPACIKMFGPIKPNVNLIPHTGSLFIIKNCYIPFTGKAFSFSHVFFLPSPPFSPSNRISLFVGEFCLFVCAHLGVGVGFDAICMSHALCCDAGSFRSIGLVTLHSYTGTVCESTMCRRQAEWFSIANTVTFMFCLCFAYFTFRRKIKYVLFRMENKIKKGGSKSTRSLLGQTYYYVGGTCRDTEHTYWLYGAVVLLWVKVWHVLGTKDTVPAVCVFCVDKA